MQKIRESVRKFFYEAEGRKGREVVRLVAYCLFLPTIIGLLYLFKQEASGGVLGIVFDGIFNTKNASAIYAEDLSIGLMAVFLFMFLPLDLLLLKVTDNDKWFVVSFSIIVLLTTLAVGVAAVCLMVNVAYASVISVVGLGLFIHLVRGINMFYVLKGGHDKKSYLPLIYMLPAFFFIGIDWSVLVGVGAGIFLVILIVKILRTHGLEFTWAGVLSFLMLGGQSEAEWLVSKNRNGKCPKCKKIVTGKRVILGEKKYTATDSWKSKEKWGEVQTKTGNKVADVYHTVEHSKEVTGKTYRYRYEWSCVYCGNYWKSDVKERRF
jgi:hypothetical protein